MAARAKVQPGEAEEDRKNTKRLVLRKLVLPATVASELGLPTGTAGPNGEVVAWVPVLNENSRHGPDGEVRVFRGGKRAVIHEYAGSADDPEARPGTYRAPPVRSWRGGVEIVLPELPKPEASLFDD